LKLFYSFSGSDTLPLPENVTPVSSGGFPDGKPCGKLTGRLQINDISESWAGGSVQITVYRPVGAGTGGVDADDAVSLISPEREYGDKIAMGRRMMVPQGITHVILNIDPMRTTQGNREFDFSQLRELGLNLGADDKNPVYVRDLRVCDENESVGAPAEPMPGDSISYMQNQDQSCYTYELGLVDPPTDIRELSDELGRETARLRDAIRVAQIGGSQTLYAEAADLVSDIALKARALYPWTNDPDRRRKDLSDALEIVREHISELDPFSRGIVHADDEDDSNIRVPAVPDLPDLSSHKIEGSAFVDGNGTPAVLYAMNYHHRGPLLRFFAPDDHRIESYSVGGCSRYDTEWSPVYRTFHQNEDAKRVGWRGWCGHLIKDQWAMGGRKENVVICMENDAIREAVRQYNQEHVHEWRHNPNMLYNIVQYELMYMCYCKKSVAMYHTWLREKYGDVNALSEAWGESHQAFEDIVPPAAPDGMPEPGTNHGAWHDWTFWNTRRFTDILKWARDSIRELDPKIAICAGGTSSMMSSANGTSGIDEELIINELDDVILHEGSHLLSLDLLRALSDKPKPVVDPEFGGSSYEVFKNFLHGKSTISKFWWPKQPSRCYPHMTMNAPMQGRVDLREVYEHMRVALDARRLGSDIACFWDLKADVAIHYSKSSILQVPYGLLRARTTPYIQALRLSYDASTRLDAPVTFVSERQLRNGKAAESRIVILPAVKHMPQDVFDSVDGYLKTGGTVVMLPESCTSDEYAKPQDYLSRWGITVNNVSVPQVLGLGPAEQGYDQSFSSKVEFGEGRQVSSDMLSGDFFPVDDGTDLTIETDGIFQELDVEGGDVLASGDGTPILVRKQIGKGLLYIFAGTPTHASLREVVDILMDHAEVHRPVRVTGPKGERLSQLECRVIHTKFHDLVYVVNESNEDVPFRIQTTRPFYRIREMRSLKYWDGPEGVIPARQALLFKFMEDPVDIGQRKEAPLHPFRGL
jgi:hypothetical protein